MKNKSLLFSMLVVSFVILFLFPAWAKDEPQVLVDGKDVWPPQGKECEKFIRCCEAVSKREETAPLMCRLIVAKQPVNCIEGLQTLRQYLKERNKEAPGECR